MIVVSYVKSILFCMAQRGGPEVPKWSYRVAVQGAGPIGGPAVAATTSTETLAAIIPKYGGPPLP